MQNIYHLYLDESETHDLDSNKSWINRIFCIAGIIVKKEDNEDILSKKLNQIKVDIWGDLPNPTGLILHEKDIRFAQNGFNKYKLNEISSEYHRFRARRYSKILYKGLGDLISSDKITVIGGCIVLDELIKYYSEEILTDQYLVATQIILENFCHFLQKNNGIGYVFYESREEHQNKDIRMRFNQIKTMGTMYISPYAMQRNLIHIDFPSKSENVAGLQVADFLPNNIVRKVSGGLYNKKMHEFNLYQPIRKSRYDGGFKLFNRFGIKIMP
ncbi:DUF3800 domain-containing protein [Clostridium guangxiense]|uniref:DUF3800 domain-containing protein n=1 Tax=Clostridium guangxiense TaxID=1662055 RepID=UPI001E50F7FC|nr:DUF3800 domain-containing protein [Clostridium guangxiense]